MKVYLLDGAMGTAIQKYDLKKEGYSNYRYCNEMQNKLNPEIIKEIHRKYILSGSEIIETNTFNCNLLSLVDDVEKADNLAELEVYNLCKEGCKLAKEVVGEFENKDIKIAGSIGPTFFSLSSEIKKDPSKKEVLRKIYRSQIEAIVDSDVDFLFFETVFDKMNLVVGLELAFEIMKEKDKKIPIVVSLAIGENGKIYTGEALRDIVKEIDCDGIVGYGFNCCSMGKYLIRELEECKSIGKLTICYPNAGFPDKDGNYTIIKEDFDNFYKEIIDRNLVDIVGGCCGMGYEEISNLKNIR